MFTMRAFEAYEQSGLDGGLGILSPSMTSVYFEEDGSLYVAPYGETEADILDRIERSKKAGRNLFKEEWELHDQEYEPGCVY